MKCRICDGKDLSLAIDLKDQPWGNHFLTKEEVGKEPFYPLRVVYCNSCQASQLDYTVKKEVMFANHTYLSGITRSLSNHFAEVAGEVDQAYFSSQGSKSCLDIGSNDGTQLGHYKKLGYDVLGVESSVGIAEIANQNGIKTLNAFFNLETAKKIGKKFDVMNASGVFFHLEELHSVTEAIQSYLMPQGVFVVQFLYIKSIMDNIAFDQIYHEHLLYYSLTTINKLLDKHGLILFDARLSPIHGGSIIGFVCHKGAKEKSERLQDLLRKEEEAKCNELSSYLCLAKNIETLKEKNLDFLSAAKKAGKKIYGMGAPVKGNTLLNYFGIGTETLDVLVEKNELRKGLYSPGMHIPIVLEKEIMDPPDIYYVLAWNFKKEILANNKALLDKGVEFYFPVDPKV